jgi:hypothetical protein
MRRAWPIVRRLAAACAPGGARGGAGAPAAAAWAQRGNASAAGDASEPSAREGPVGPPVTPAEAGFPYLIDLTGRGADPAYFRNAHLSGMRRPALKPLR